MKAQTISGCGSCLCGANSDNGYKHHAFCIVEIPGPFKALAPYWWLGWNECVLGLPNRIHEGGHDPRVSFKMGYMMALELQERARTHGTTPPQLHPAPRPKLAPQAA